MTETRPSRADQREATRQRILDHARRLFAERGYERTTIRTVAAAARVDPRLVMHYFGSKAELFATAVRTTPSGSAAGGVTDVVLDSLGIKLNGMPETSLAMLRSMLTHPQAAEHAREVLRTQVGTLSTRLPYPDAELRVATMLAVALGVTIARHLLDLEPLRDASPGDLVELLRPALDALAEPGADGDPVGGAWRG